MRIINEHKFYFAYYKQHGYTKERAIEIHNELQKIAGKAKRKMQIEASAERGNSPSSSC